MLKAKNVPWTIISILISVIVLLSACAVPQKPTATPTFTTPPTQTVAPASKPGSLPTSIPPSTAEPKVIGTISYLEKIALPPGAAVEIKLLDISKQDVAAVTIGEQIITTSGQQVPFPFEIKYNPATIDPRFTYAVRASITVDGKLWFTTDTRYAVITQGNPTTVELILKKVTVSPAASGLENTMWVLQSYGEPSNLKTVLTGSTITALFDSTKGQIAGSSGVNRYSGSYELKDNKLSISKSLASTMMAGPQPFMDQEKEYLTALQAAESYQIKNGQLQINCGQKLLIFVTQVSKELSVDFASSGKEVTMAVGDTLIVNLDSNITTGYSWNESAAIGNKAVIQQTDHKYQPPAAPIPGAGGKEVWNFKALKEGSSTITMDYRRPFETGVAPIKTFTLSVIVK